VQPALRSQRLHQHQKGGGKRQASQDTRQVVEHTGCVLCSKSHSAWWGLQILFRGVISITYFTNNLLSIFYVKIYQKNQNFEL
jgi:hypothetical protein